MIGMAVRLRRMLAAAIYASVWLVFPLTILVYVATAPSRTEPGAGRGISIIPEASSFDGAESFADVAPPFLAERQVSGSERLIPSLAPDPITSAMFWDKGAREWSSGLSHGNAGYEDSELIPSLLRVGDLIPGAAYQIWLDYSGCHTPPSAGFNFLGSSPGGDAAPDLTTAGPRRSLPDARIPIPADASHVRPAGVFDLWGATFVTSPQGPFPSPSCSENKLIILRVLARSDTIFLLWGSQVAGGGRDPELFSPDSNAVPGNTGAGQETLSPLTATVWPDPP